MSGAFGLICVAAAFYRLQDFLFASLDQALGLTGKRSFTGTAWQGPVLIALINLGQVVLVFAIAYQVLVTRSAFTPAPAGTRFGHLFLSWRSLPPLGSGYLPQTAGSRILAILESGTGILMLTITLARFLRGPSGAEVTTA